MKNTILTKIAILFFISVLINQCGIVRKTDARKIPVNANDRQQKNLEQGKRIRFGSSLGGTGKFDFASSNEMWKASIKILDFMPLSSADYGGGIIITDWYNNDLTSNEQLKIMIRFLSNEIRADGLEITIYKKFCNSASGTPQCSTAIDDGEIGSELKLAILKKAAAYKNLSEEKAAKEFRKIRPAENRSQDGQD